MGLTQSIFLGIIALILIILAIIFTIKSCKSKKRKRGPDYFAMFIMGVIWLAIGISSGNSPLWTIGLIFFIIGLVHKNEWKKNKVHWKDLDKKEKKIRCWIMSILMLIIIVGLFVLILIF